VNGYVVVFLLFIISQLLMSCWGYTS